MKISKCWCKLPENVENIAKIFGKYQNYGERYGKLHKIHFRGNCGK